MIRKRRIRIITKEEIVGMKTNWRKKNKNPKTTVSLIASLNPALSKRVFKAIGNGEKRERERREMRKDWKKKKMQEKKFKN